LIRANLFEEWQLFFDQFHRTSVSPIKQRFSFNGAESH